MLNRSALIVRAKQPFLDWLRQLPDPVNDDLTLADLNDEPHVYLLPEWEEDTDRDRLLRGCFKTVFENELAGWWTAESDWPAKRTFKVFSDWFDAACHSMLIDLVDGPLLDDDAE